MLIVTSYRFVHLRVDDAIQAELALFAGGEVDRCDAGLVAVQRNGEEADGAFGFDELAVDVGDVPSRSR